MPPIFGVWYRSEEIAPAYNSERHEQHRTLSGNALQAITSMEKHHKNPISSLSALILMIHG